VDNWIIGIDASDNTRRNYLHSINTYCGFLSKNSDQIINEAKAEIRAGMLMDEKSMFVDIPRFKQHLKKKNLAPNTIRGYIMAIQSYYSYYNIQFPKQRNLESTILESNIDIPTKEDIQSILKVCDPLEKAIILVGISSGLSSNEIINLKVGNFKDGYNPITSITTLRLRRGKTKVDFITFLSSESSHGVIDYLEFRERKSDSTDVRKQNQLMKQRVYSNDDYLFIGRKIPDEWLDTKDESLRKLERNAFLKLYRMLNEKARKSTPKGMWNIIRSHNLRKFYNSALINAGADSFFVEYTMGHTIDKTKASYFRSDPNSLVKAYQKFMPFITIQRELDISESEDFKRIKSEHETLLIEAEKHRVERQELQELRGEVDKLKNNGKRLGQMSTDIKTVHAKIHDDYFKDKDVREDIKAHEERMKVDPEYREQFNIYDRAYKILELGEGTREEFNEMLEKEDKDILESKLRLLKTYDKFLDKL
jgi:integrase